MLHGRISAWIRSTETSESHFSLRTCENWSPSPTSVSNRNKVLSYQRLDWAQGRGSLRLTCYYGIVGARYSRAGGRWRRLLCSLLIANRHSTTTCLFHYCKLMMIRCWLFKESSPVVLLTGLGWTNLFLPLLIADADTDGGKQQFPSPVLCLETKTTCH